MKRVVFSFINRFSIKPCAHIKDEQSPCPIMCFCFVALQRSNIVFLVIIFCVCLSRCIWLSSKHRHWQID